MSLREIEANRVKNKNFLLQWLTDADFTKEINLAKLCEHPFKLDEDEEAVELKSL